LIVFIAIPVTLALTLAVFYLYGYTLNRITLFALIFSIGILVDDSRISASRSSPPTSATSSRAAGSWIRSRRWH
jgi:preprotein translocase subunit SecD